MTGWPKNICDSCPHWEAQSLVGLLPWSFQADVLKLMKMSDNNFEDLVFWMSIGILWEQEPLEPTLIEMRKCLKAIWDIGNWWGGQCDTKNATKITCFRKYLFDETLIYLKQTWLLSGRNQERFQALLWDTWTKFFVTFGH